MRKKIITPILGELFQKIAPQIGAKIIIEPEWGIVGQINYKNGKKRYFRYTSIDLNTLGSSEIAKDKDYANFFMKKMGYPTIPGKTFYSNDWCQAINSKRNIAAANVYAQKLGFPLIVKPNSGSQGNNIILVHNKTELSSALKKVFLQDKIALVQKYISGQDYRIVVLDNKIISAYQRMPLNITGDGSSNIKKLIKMKLDGFVISERPANIGLQDHRILQNLKKNKLTMQSVLLKDQKVTLLNNANLSSGGDSLDVTSSLHPEFKKIAISLTRDMGLRLCGVDLMVNSDISQKPKKYWVIEINAAPGLDHYIKTGAKQQKIVEDMYLEVLKAMEK